MVIFINALDKTVLTPTAESTLALKRSELQTLVADFAELGRAVPTASDALARVNAAIDSGLRQVYWPNVLPGEVSAHEWSWMRPVRTFTTAAEFNAYQLPSDFGGIEGDITYALDQAFRTIRVVGENDIRRRQQSNTAAGIPQWAAVRPFNSGLSGQRYELLLWPTPDTEYDLTFRYNINPDALASANDYALGGPALTETILQSCRAAADRIFNDNVGAEYQLFIERLKASVTLDRRTLAPEYLGTTQDPGMLADRFFPYPYSGHHGFGYGYALPGFTFNGVTIQ